MAKVSKQGLKYAALVTELSEPATGAISGIGGALSAISLGRQGRQAIKGGRRMDHLKYMKEDHQLTEELEAIRKYAYKKNKRLVIRKSIGATAAGISLGGTAVAAAPPAAAAMWGSSAAIGVGLGGWKTKNWIRKKYETAKTLRKLSNKETRAVEGVLSDIFSTFTRGKTKLGQELVKLNKEAGLDEIESMRGIPLLERKYTATRLLNFLHKGDESERQGASLILEALNLDEKVMHLILSNPEATEKEDLVKEVMRKIRST